MINLEFDKYCNISALTNELIAAGVVLYPNTNACFYGCSYIGVDPVLIIVHCYDDITSSEQTIITNIVNSHTP